MRAQSMVPYVVPESRSNLFTSWAPVHAFDGRSSSCQSFVGDINLSLALNHSLHANDESKKIVYAAGFLNGPPWRWYLDLLIANVALNHDNERGAVRSPTLDRHKERPAYWATYPFIIPEFASLKTFLHALEKEFPGDEVSVDYFSNEFEPRPALRRLSTAPLANVTNAEGTGSLPPKLHTPPCFK